MARSPLRIAAAGFAVLLGLGLGCTHDTYQQRADIVKDHVEAFYSHLKANHVEAAVRENEQIEAARWLWTGVNLPLPVISPANAAFAPAPTTVTRATYIAITGWVPPAVTKPTVSLTALLAHESQHADPVRTEELVRAWAELTASAAGLPEGRRAEAFLRVDTA